MPEEIPAYQIMCLATGRNIGVTIPPIIGWAITHSILGAEMFEDEAECDKRIHEIANSKVKYPKQTSRWKAWLHFQEGCPEGVSNRKHWSPR